VTGIIFYGAMMILTGAIKALDTLSQQWRMVSTTACKLQRCRKFHNKGEIKNIFWIPTQKTINQLTYSSRCNRHWTGHQGRMQPPLTRARKVLIKATNDNT